ncbi:phage tail protein [Herminiimonas sp. KBW02]|uniref:portal protein n=1 Tax=Herminiimonas sp. KBW02 TaxID=2153363 RepID=UPI000F596F68|nr:portal protein [Herminiimonas sp. KBW02]RQO38622.1 phage tail protein [Herminiimonas sp. KBW02]
MSESIVDQVLRRKGQMVAQRQPYDQVWKEVFEYLAPERATAWYGFIEAGANTAQSQRARLYDNTAMDDAEVLKSSLASGVHPANSRWLDIDAGQTREDETRWMDGASQFIFENIHNSGFDAVGYENLSDLVPAGWFVMYIDQRRDSDGNEIGGFNFESWPLYQCYVGASKANGRVDTICRVWQPTIEQLVTEYGLDNVSESSRRKYEEGKLTETVECVWMIEPNAKDRKGFLKNNLPFRSIHIECNAKTLLRESGYHEFPCAVPRWRLIPGTPYATGIGSNVLPNVKTLNDILRMEMESLDIAIYGMWKGVDDGVFNPRTARVGARKIIMMASPESLTPLKTGADFNVSFSKADQLRQSISKSLMSDSLTPLTGGVLSATEVQARINKIRAQLGPMFARLQGEYLQVMVERCFAIAYRSGVLEAELGPIPETLKGRDFIVKYLNPLARAQKMEQVNAIDALIAGLIQTASAAQNPALLDVIDMDAANYEKGLALGVPANLLRGPEQLTEKRKTDIAAAEQAQQQAQQQQLQQVAGEKAIEASMAQ